VALILIGHEFASPADKFPPRTTPIPELFPFPAHERLPPDRASLWFVKIAGYLVRQDSNRR
jgi:hypothetical protein